MKKYIMLITAILWFSAAAFAEGLSIKGFVRAGYSSTFGDDASGNSETWLGGEYFGDVTRACVNFLFDNKDATAGAQLTLQWNGEITQWSTANGYPLTKFGFAYIKLFDKRVTIVGGKIKDLWLCSGGNEQYSVMKGNPGAAVIITPVKGLNIGGGVLEQICNYAIDDTTKAFFGGIKYSNSIFSASASYAGVGIADFGLKLTAVKDLSISAEYQYAHEDAIKTVTSTAVVKASVYPYESVFDEQVEYTGIPKLTLGVLSHQFVNSYSGPLNAVTSSSDWKLTVTPAAAYAITDMYGLSVEGTYTAYSEDSKDAYFTVTPSFKIAIDKTAEADLWGTISSDEDQADTCAGIGVIKRF